MSLNVEEMSWSEIINEFDLMIKDMDTLSMIKSGINETIQNRFILLIKDLMGEKGQKGRKKKLVEFLENYENYFDKTRFVMAINKNYADKQESILNNRSIKSLYEETQKALVDMADSGVNKQIVFLKKANDKDRLYDCSIESINSLIGRPEKHEKRKSEQIKLLRKSNITIYELLQQSPYLTFISAENMDFGIKAIINWIACRNANSDILSQDFDQEALEKLTKEEQQKYLEELSKILEDNIEYIDLEGLVIGASITNFVAIDKEELSNEERNKAIARLNKFMKYANTIAQKGLLINPSKELMKTYNLLKEGYENRTVKGKLIASHNVDELVNDLVLGNCKLRDIGEEVLSFLTSVPTEVFLNDLENFSYAVQKNWLREGLYEMIKMTNDVGTDVAVYGIQNNLLSKNELIQLYTDKHISLERIREIEEANGQLIKLEDVIQAYKSEYEEIKEEGTSRENQFEEMALKVHNLQEPGFESEKVEEALFDESIQSTEVAMLMFYKNYLLDAKTVVSSCGNQVIGALRPADVRQLYLDKTIKMEDIEQSILTLNGENAIHFICKLFPGKEYSEEFNRLVQFIDVQNEERSRNLGGHRKKKGENKGVYNTGHIGIEAISYKYQIYEALDHDYACEQSKNGYGIFILPNVKYKGTEDSTVVIEPIIDKSHKTGNVMAAQNKAMYIMPQTLWNQEKKYILEGNIVKSDELRKTYSYVGRSNMTQMKHSVSSLEKIKEKEEEIKKGKIPKDGWPFRLFNQMSKGREYTPEETKNILKLCIELEYAMTRE